MNDNSNKRHSGEKGESEERGRTTDERREGANGGGKGRRRERGNLEKMGGAGEVVSMRRQITKAITISGPVNLRGDK